MTDSELEAVDKRMAFRDRWLLLTEGQRQGINAELADDVPGLVAEIRRLRELYDHEREQRDMRHRAWLEGIEMLKAANDREQILIEALNTIKRRHPELFLTEDKPIPMCRVDPLHDLFPAGEGSPT